MNLTSLSRVFLWSVLINESVYLALKAPAASQVTNSDAVAGNSKRVKKYGNSAIATNKRVADHVGFSRGLERASVARNRNGFQPNPRHPSQSAAPAGIRASRGLDVLPTSKRQVNDAAKNVPETTVAVMAVVHQLNITAHGHPFEPKPAHKKPRPGTAAQTKTAFAAAHGALVAGTASFNAVEAGERRPYSSALYPNFTDPKNGGRLRDPKENKETEESHETPAESSEVHFSPASNSESSDAEQEHEEEGEADEKGWPATDVLPVRDENGDDNATLTPRPLVWEETEEPPEPVLFIPLLVLVAGLACLFCMLIMGGGPPFGVASPSASRGPNMHTKVDAIFQAADQDRDGFVSFPEMRRLARLTNLRGTSLTREWFSDLCRPLGADPRRGLDRTEFSRTYQLLGIDVDKDYDTIQHTVDRQATEGNLPAGENQIGTRAAPAV